IYGSLNLSEITIQQEGPLKFTLLGNLFEFPNFIPNWGIFYQPLGFILYTSCAFAECNRLPFDLPESEGELVAGFHTEYGGFKMLLFFMGEYGHMMVSSSLLTIFFFGGFGLPVSGWTPEFVQTFFAGIFANPTHASILTSVVFLLS